MLLLPLLLLLLLLPQSVEARLVNRERFVESLESFYSDNKMMLFEQLVAAAAAGCRL